MNTWAEVGKRCVCICEEFPEIASYGPYSLPVRVPMLNEVVTITAVRADKGEVFLTFEEIDVRQKSGPLYGQIWWNVLQFRPLEERKTDISVFTSMLTPAGRVDA